MNEKFTKYLVLTIIVLMNATFCFSQNEGSNGWTQFRGDNRDGTSNDGTIQSDWLNFQPELMWKKEIGSGFSEILISNGRIYTIVGETTDSITGFEFIVAFDEKTGNEIWRSKLDSIYFDADGWGNGARSTPTFDDKLIYSFSGKGKLSANSLIDGSLVWQVDFVKEFGSTIPRWGFASSPLLIDDKLIMEVGGTDNRAFVAFNKTDGKVIWASQKGAASHESPLLANIDGQQQIIFANGGTLFSLKPEGDTLWTYKMPFGGVTAIPLFISPNKIFVSAVRNPGFFIVQIENNIAAEILQSSSMKNDFSSCVYNNGNIFGFHVAALRCISADSGDVKWTKRGFGKGSLILIGDKLLVLSDKGKLILVEATADAYKELGSIQTIEGKSWTAPSYSNGKVFMRNLTEMACFKLK